MSNPTGAKVIAQALNDLGVTVLFGLVGLPVTDIAEQAIDLGIRFVGFRNEQAASYAATAYGYITGKPGVCLLVGGPGVIHGMAANASANAWPTLFLGGSSETSLWTKGGFQEMDAISLLTPHTKRAIRPYTNNADAIVSAIEEAYRICWYGRPGASFVDLPTDFIMTPVSSSIGVSRQAVLALPRPAASEETIQAVADLLKSASAPLIIIGKGAAYARAENQIRALVNNTRIPFLPTPMGKGVIPDSHPLNTSSARSVALHEADVVLLLGARLNWILHYGAFPKYRKDVKIVHVDISPEELGGSNSNGSPALSVFGDVGTVAEQLNQALSGWTAFSSPSISKSVCATGSQYLQRLRDSSLKNEAKAQKAAQKKTAAGQPLTFERAFQIIKDTLHSISAPENGDVVYIGEGSQTMDISRPIFPLEHPRQKLDAGTYATMGVGLAYCIAAWTAYNLPKKTKKIVALEGDSALGFAAMEVETMRRGDMDVLVFCLNNSGIYSGDTADSADWKAKQQNLLGRNGATERRDRLKSSSLMHETRYEQLAQMVGGRAFFVRTEDDLERATREGYAADVVTVVNVIIEPGNDKNISFAWMDAKAKAKM